MQQWALLLLFLVSTMAASAERAAHRVLTEEQIDELAANAEVAVASDLEFDGHRVGSGSDMDHEYVDKYRMALQLMEDRNFQPAIKLLKDYIYNYQSGAFPANRQLARALWLDGKFSEATYWFGRVLYIAEAKQSRPQLRVAYGLFAEFLADMAHSWSQVLQKEIVIQLEDRQHQMEKYPLHKSIPLVAEAEDKEVIVDMADVMFENAIQHLDEPDKYHYQQWAFAIGAHGRYKKAIKVTRYALDARMNPAQPAYDEDVYKVLADFHRSQRKFDKCIKFGNSALSLAAVDVIFVLSDCYLGLHKPKEAMNVLTQTAEVYAFLKNEILYGAYIAQVLAFQGRNDEALAKYREALELSTDENLQGSLYIAIAKLEDSTGDHEQAHNDYSVGAELLFDKWIYRNYKPRWEVVDRPCPRKQIHQGHITDFDLIDSRELVRSGIDSFGEEGMTPLAAPGLAEAAGWQQKQELYFEEPSIYHLGLPHSAIFGESSLNVLQCGLLLGYPTSLDEANGLTKVVTRVEKGVFVGPGGGFADVSAMLLRKLPQLQLLKERKAFKEEDVVVPAPRTPFVLETFGLLGLTDHIYHFDPMITSVLMDKVDLIEFAFDQDADTAAPFEKDQFVSKWAVGKTRRLLMPEGDLPAEERNKIVVIKSMPKFEVEMTIARQAELHEALRQLGEVVVFNPFSSSLSLEKIKNVFQSASVVVGPHSHGMAGMIYAARGTPVVELPVMGGTHNLYANVATALDLPYWIVPTCQTPRLGEYDLSESQIQDVVTTVRLALVGEGGEHVPLYKQQEAHHDEL